MKAMRASRAPGKFLSFDISGPEGVKFDRIELVDLDVVIEQSDVISLHAPATPATHSTASGMANTRWPSTQRARG